MGLMGMEVRGVCLLLLGVGGSFALWFGIRTAIRRDPTTRMILAKTTGVRGFLLFVGNLAIVAGGIVISAYALYIAEGGHAMTSPELTNLYTMIMRMFDVFWVIIGFVIGTGILFLIQAVRAGRNIKKQEEIKAIAYRIWQDEGHPNGRNVEHWARAEQIWREQRRKRRHRKGA